MNLLYHRVNPLFVEKVQECGFLKTSKTLDGEHSVCLTRDFRYMSASRPYVVVFDRDLLKRKGYIVKPFCMLYNLSKVRIETHDRFIKMGFVYGFEHEERVYNDLPLELSLFHGFVDFDDLYNVLRLIKKGEYCVR